MATPPIYAREVPQGQNTATNSMPVVLASDSSTLPISVTKATVLDVLFPSAVRTATATSATFLSYGDATALIAQVEVTAASGTTPTLDIVLQDTVDGTNWNTFYTFAQLITTGRPVKRYIPSIAADGPISDTIRAVATIAGTTSPSFTFSVKVYSRR